MDKIIIQDLEVWWRVGVPEAERAQPQRLWVTLELATDLSRAAATDDLGATIDYYRVVQRLQQWGEPRSWQLLEKLAADVAQVILTEFHPDAVRVEVKKFILPQTRHVAVCLTRPRPVKV